MCVAGHCHAEKWLHHLQICHTAGKRYWSGVSTYFSEFCFATKKTSSDEPREEMAAQTITDPPPKFLFKKMFFWALWHRANNIHSHLDHPNSISSEKITESQFISELTFPFVQFGRIFLWASVRSGWCWCLTNFRKLLLWRHLNTVHWLTYKFKLFFKSLD